VVSVWSPPTRLVAGIEVPAVGTWAIDPDHAYVGFSARRLAVASIRGRFAAVLGQVNVAEELSDSSVEAIIATASVASGSGDRDDQLRSAEHLDVDRHPTAVFRSTHTRWNGRRGLVIGQLTLVGVTNTVELEVVYRGTVVDPWGAHRSVFSAGGVINRDDWGVSWNVTLEGGGLLVSRHIGIEIEVETIRRLPSRAEHRRT
jgi:polyisoprenoid-binding protein YceI